MFVGRIRNLLKSSKDCAAPRSGKDPVDQLQLRGRAGTTVTGKFTTLSGPMVHSSMSPTPALLLATPNPDSNPLGQLYVGRAQIGAVGADGEHSRCWAHIVGPPGRDVTSSDVVVC